MFEINESPTTDDINFLTEKLNNEHPEKGKAYPFEIFLRDKSNNIIAGCSGCVVFGSIHTDQLWVDPNSRGQGLGRKLMDAVHSYGKKQDCILSTLFTMSFQVPDFYKKLGYKIDFIRNGYKENSNYIYFSKEL